MADERKSLLERGLGVITEVRRGEGPTALLFTLNVFLLLTAYYVIKPVREALILSHEGGARHKSLLNALIAIGLLFAVPAYARVTSRFPRNKLIVGVTLFFVSHLGVFYLASWSESARPVLSMAFFVWVGIFNMMVVAQFWAFANDVYTEEQGKRLFALLGVGASVGAAVGSQISKQKALVEALGVYNMLLIAAAILAFCAFLSQVIHVRETRTRGASIIGASDGTTEPPRRTGGLGIEAFTMVFSNKYLRMVALFSLLFSFANTNGEFILGQLVEKQAALHGATEEARRNWISVFYGDFFAWVNWIGVGLQLFVVSRIVKFGGLRVAFFIFPAIALADALAVALFPMLAIVRIGKIAENATDYSLNNTVRNMLWLPTSREMKYKAKQAVDSFFVRMGDVTSTGLVLLGAALSWEVRAYGIANVIAVGLWLVVAVGIVREYHRLVKAKRDAADSAAEPGAEASPA